MSNPKSIGTVKWFNDAKSYGSIVNEAGEDVMVHYSEDYKALKEVQQVEFLQVKFEKGWRAAEVELMLSDAMLIEQQSLFRGTASWK